MLLSAVSVLVVAQSNSEVPEGLMNNPVLTGAHQQFVRISACKIYEYITINYRDWLALIMDV